MSHYTKISKISRRDDDHDHDIQSSFVKSFLEFRKGKPLTQAFLLQQCVILRDPVEVAYQPESPNGGGTESR